MIESVQNMIEELSVFEQNRDRLILDLIKDREVLVVDMNRQQLQDGKSGKGEEINPQYRPSTIERKRRRNQPYDRVTLKDKGDFHGSFFVRYGSDFFELDAEDQKKIYLEKKYGPDIYGLTPDNLARLTNNLKEEFIEAFRKKILV